MKGVSPSAAFAHSHCFFTAAAPPDVGQRLYEHFVALARAAHPDVATGEFGADMQIELVADGPVTMTLRTPSGAGEASDTH